MEVPNDFVEGELQDLIDEFSDGRIQFAFVKVKDPNTSLRKNVMIAWCGEGVPERTKGYFTSHLAAVSRFLSVSRNIWSSLLLNSPRQGYHVQITARSDLDITPENIIAKVSSASGSKYVTPSTTSPSLISQSSLPVAASKPVFTPNRSVGTYKPLATGENASRSVPEDDDWGPDAPPVSSSEPKPAVSAHQSTITKSKEMFPKKQMTTTEDKSPSEKFQVNKSGYRPIGKVDITAIRNKALEEEEQPSENSKHSASDSSMEKVPDVSTQNRSSDHSESGEVEQNGKPKSLAERAAAFQGSHRITSLPKPHVTNIFNSLPFRGGKVPFPKETHDPPATITSTSRSFADEGGKTPAQVWAEKKGKQNTADFRESDETSIQQQLSEQRGWKSSYSGRTWAPVQTGPKILDTSDNISQDQTAHETTDSTRNSSKAVDIPSATGPPLNISNKPNIDSDLTKPDSSVYNSVPEDEVVEPEPVNPGSDDEIRAGSPVRIALPVSRTANDEKDLPPAFPQDTSQQPRRDTGLPETSHDALAVSEGDHGMGLRAIVLYDYEKAEDNEIDLIENEYVSNIDQVDDDWWMGVNSKGEAGLFPQNYVQVLEELPSNPSPKKSDAELEGADQFPSEKPTNIGKTATAVYDYEAGEDNELSFPEGAKITEIVRSFPR